MKKIMYLIVLSLLVCGCSKTNKEKKVLRFFTWGEYMDESLLEEFEEEFDCKIIYETFDSNESMYTKLSAGNNRYDILVPSDYMIAQLIEEGRLQKINWDLIGNKDGLDTSIQSQAFDPNNEFWVSYFYGNVGIVYDKTKVDQKDLEAGWEVLRNPKYINQIYMYDSVRDSFMVALKALGYSMNTTDPQEIEAAYNWLMEQKDLVKPVYVVDTVIDAMVNGEKELAVVYSGDGAYILAENEDMDFYLPDEGTNYWFDGFVITKECEEVELAHQFINFMCEKDSALRNTYEVGYLTSVVEAGDEAREEEFTDNNAYSLRVDDLDECFVNQNMETKQLYSDYWTKVLSK